MPTYTSFEKKSLAILISQMAVLQGQLLSTQVIAAAAGKSVTKYNTLALMKAETEPLNVKLFVLLGLNAPEDGLLAGKYIYDSANAEADNGITVFQLTSTTVGRLLKID